MIKVKVIIENDEDETFVKVVDKFETDSWHELMPTFIKALNGAGYSITSKASLQTWLDSQQVY